MPHTYMPISISLKNRSCLVVGGGKVALRKIDNLIEYEPEITVIAPQVDEQIEYYAQKNRLRIFQREYRSPEATGYGLVISACDDPEVNAQVYRDCHSAGIPVNVVDAPQLCDFIFPAVIRRDSLTISVSTDGKAPYLSGHLRLILENMFAEHWQKISRYAAQFREQVQKRWPDDKGRRIESFRQFLNADWKAMVKEMSEAEIEERLRVFLETEGEKGGEDEDEEELMM